MDGLDHFVQFTTCGDFRLPFIQKDLSEERGQDLAFDVGGSCDVKLVWAFQHLQVGQDSVSGLPDEVLTPTQPVFDGEPLDGDFSKTFFGCRHFQVAVCGEVEQPSLLRLQFRQLRGKTRSRLPLARQLKLDCVLNLECHEVNEVSWEGQLTQFASDRLLDFSYGQVREVARILLTAPTQEVVIDLTGSVGDFAVDQPVRSPRLVASIAEQHSTQEMGVHPITMRRSRPHFQHSLHALERFR